MSKTVKITEKIGDKPLSSSKKRIGELIQRYRENLNMSQDMLGQEIGVSSNSISNMETGKSMPSLEHMLQICNVLGLSWEVLESLDEGTKNSEMRHYCYVVENYLSKRDQDIVVPIIGAIIQGFRDKEADKGDEGEE